MKETNNKSQEIDDEIAKAYQALAQETAPARADAAIWQEARNAVTGGSGLSRINTWLRPLILIATAAVTLALMVQLTSSPQFDLPRTDKTVVAPLPTDVLQNAAEQTAGQIFEVEQNQAISTPPAASIAKAAKANPVERFTLLPSRQQCDDESRATSGTWWQCLRELEQRGLSEAAERELQALLQAFPQFSAPQ
jgi:hypothetical protein